MPISLDDVIANKYDKVIRCFEKESDERGVQNYVCQINGCALKYNSSSASIRHVRLNHQDAYKTIQTNKKNGNSEDNSPFNKLFEIRVKVNPEEIWNACVDLVTIHALPLFAVEYPAFKKILQPYVISLNRQGIELTVNRSNIKNRIEKRAQAIKNHIISEAKNRMVCLMLLAGLFDQFWALIFHISTTAKFESEQLECMFFTFLTPLTISKTK